VTPLCYCAPLRVLRALLKELQRSLLHARFMSENTAYSKLSCKFARFIVYLSKIAEKMTLNTKGNMYILHAVKTIK